MLTPIIGATLPGRARRALVAMVAALLLAGCTGSAPSDGPTLPTPAAPDARSVAASTAAIRSDLAALQQIADQHGGNRAAGTPGHDASVAYVTGRLLAAGYRPQVQRFELQSDTDQAVQPGTNILAELPGTRSDNVVMVGAHLDSVPAGPGMNDDASGAAATLELARQLAGARLPATVRFAWWDGEELGHQGSNHYVGALDEPARQRIAAYLNLDGIGSPNFVRQVYQVDDASPPGSEVIERTLSSYFHAQRLPVELVELGGRSDHAAFAAAGIPIGGLFTGTDRKTHQEQATYGGTTGPADACNHQSCDNLGNINLTVLDQMEQAARYAVATLARDTSPLDRARDRG